MRPNDDLSDFMLPKGKGRGGGLFRLLLYVMGAVLLAGLVFALFIPASRSARPASRRVRCINNLRQIQMALELYEAANGRFPPAFTTDAEGLPLHSWRVLILPYLDADDLYRRIDLTKPWDDPANSWARQEMPGMFHCPANETAPGLTTYFACVGPNAFLAGGVPRNRSEIRDDPALTLGVYEVPVERAVCWMAPADVSSTQCASFGEGNQWAHPGGSNASFVDGSVLFLKRTISPKVKAALFTIDGGERIAKDAL